MTTKYVTGQPQIGRIWVPEAKVSYPTGGKCAPKHGGVVCASQGRLWGTIHGIWKFEDEPDLPDGNAWLEEKLAPYRGEVNPVYFERQYDWVSVTHNERPTDGASMQIFRMFGTVGVGANAVIINIALGASAIPTGGGVITKTATDSSLGTNAQGVTTLEFTTLGLSRAISVPSNFVAATTLDGTASLDLIKTGAGGSTVFTATGTADVRASGVFDHLTVASSYLFCEDNFSSTASMVNTDTLAVTWTLTL